MRSSSPNPTASPGPVRSPTQLAMATGSTSSPGLIASAVSHEVHTSSPHQPASTTAKAARGSLLAALRHSDEMDCGRTSSESEGHFLSRPPDDLNLRVVRSIGHGAYGVCNEVLVWRNRWVQRSEGKDSSASNAPCKCACHGETRDGQDQINYSGVFSENGEPERQALKVTKNTV
ncbi:unnamed protein product [Protopolystoma xenopodis]|uniref:Uncharacterized protein n=1 Tax=Protopolystoma xenopodis TaxID=117903 RepID=A0A448WLC8_9PLAT|nr:unnamed protein product [Protopolystoma xenopodis]